MIFNSEKKSKYIIDNIKFLSKIQEGINLKKLFLIIGLMCSFSVIGYIIYFTKKVEHMNQTNYIELLNRPKNIPMEAFWQSDIIHGGGYWYFCKNQEVDFNYRYTIYDEDGESVWEDDFELYISLYASGKEISVKDFQKQIYLTKDEIMDFDGITDIHIQGGMLLKSKNYTLEDPISYKRLHNQ